MGKWQHTKENKGQQQPIKKGSRRPTTWTCRQGGGPTWSPELFYKNNSIFVLIIATKLTPTVFAGLLCGGKLGVSCGVHVHGTVEWLPAERLATEFAGKKSPDFLARTRGGADLATASLCQ